MIPQSFIDDLLQRVDVVEVVGRSVKLRKAGANHIGLCPFHNEKSPSFTVSPTKQFYHCFGCGAHGTAIGFLIEYSGLTFPEAVRDLAQSAGMTVPDVRRAERGSGSDEPAAQLDRGSSTAIIEALEVAAGFYRHALRGSGRAIEYLKGRGLTGEVAARFGMGYAPDGWNALADAFVDYREPVLVDAGLVIVKEDGDGDGSTGRSYDRFRDRIMFPIRNTRGRVIGFGGRVIDNGEPKYLNSPETPVFEKGRELYGLFEARQAIRTEGFAVVVEGYMDVVALAQLGVANAVATLGTACTPHHVQKLMRQTDQVTFSFDGDAAGRKAAWRALEAALPHAADDKAFRFLFLPPEHDPDSYVRAFGRDAFVKALRESVPLSEYLIGELKRTNDLATAEGRAKMLFDGKPHVRALPEGALRLQIVRTLALLGQVTVDDVLASYQLAQSGGPQRRERPRIARVAPQGLVHRALVALIMHPVNALSLTASELQTLDDAAGESRDLLGEVIDAARRLGATADFVAMADALRESVHAEVFESLMQEILAIDENRRELLLVDGSTEAPAEAGQAAHELHARELRDLIRKLRSQAIVVALERLSATGLPDESSAAEYRRLIEERHQIDRSGAADAA